MRIGLVVNDIKTEESGYTTTRLGMAGANLGHEMWVLGVGDLAYDPDDPAATPIEMSDSRFAENPGTWYRNSSLGLMGQRSPAA